MKNSKFLLLVSIFCMFIIILINNGIKIDKNCDLFTNICKDTSSNIVEYGVEGNFQDDLDSKETCDCLFNSINISNKNKKITKNEKEYCIDFKDETFKGYIKGVKQDKDTIFKFKIIKKDKNNDLDKLEMKVKDSINNENIKMYKYLKYKTEPGDLEKINNNLLKNLKDNRSINVDTVKINNGYSNTAYTGRFEPIKVNKKLVDFNFSVCKYSSGNYIIMGTPQIVVSY